MLTTRGWVTGTLLALWKMNQHMHAMSFYVLGGEQDALDGRVRLHRVSE